MVIKEARKYLSDEDNKKYSDQEVQQIINSLHVVADIALDQWFKMTPKERKKYNKQR